MKKLKKEIEFSVAALSDRSGTITPQAKHEFQIHLRELLQIKRNQLKKNMNEITHGF